MQLILASASPRRRELLAGAGLEFRVEVSDADETPAPDRSPEEVSVDLARRKAATVAARYPGLAQVVLAADTIVATGEGVETTLLGKPDDPEEAARMLGLLSGTRHRVVTGVCALRCDGGQEAAAWERTWVRMRVIAPSEIEAYVDSGEWRDKAGGYAIQETADAFVEQLDEGGFDNVVGLPVALSLRLLKEVGFPARPA